VTRQAGDLETGRLSPGPSKNGTSFIHTPARQGTRTLQGPDPERFIERCRVEKGRQKVGARLRAQATTYFLTVSARTLELFARKEKICVSQLRPSAGGDACE